MDLIDLDPASSVGPPLAVETHISVVMLFGSRAWKLCKPVDVGFLDLRRVQDRRAVLHRELEVNRRFAPDIYLGILDLVDEAGAVVDHALVMRRLPAAARLATIIRPGGAESAVQLDAVRQVARRVAAIHAAAPRPAAALEAASPLRLAQNWADNLAVLAGHDPGDERIGRIEALAAQFLHGREALFKARAVAGKAIDGHGDLLADDIFCLPDGPRILDCLAFRDDYRYGDVLLDAAFLAMDLERLGGAELAERFLDWYQEFSGEQHPVALAHYFVAYRASVRAKVSCLRVQQGESDAKADLCGYVEQCLSHLERARIRMVMVGGPPGTGKSTVAKSLARSTGWVLLRSDELRPDPTGPTPSAGTSTDAGMDAGRYGQAGRDGVYRELCRQAEVAAGLGHSVILDATWADAGQREQLRQGAERAGADLVELCLRVPLAVAQARVSERRALGQDPSEVTAELVPALTERFEPWPEAVELDGQADPATACRTPGLGPW